MTHFSRHTPWLASLRRSGAGVALIAGSLCAAGVAQAAQPALPIDGVTLIDQSKVLAGNITPGDAPGFPVTISQPGSYRLASNLTVPDGNTTAIHISADNVTLDLNGFAILGPVDCSTGFPCVGAGSGSGVQTFPLVGKQNPRFNITVRNGSIQGMGGMGINLVGDSNLVEHVTARSNGHFGIFLVDSFDAGASAVRNSTALRNGGIGISVLHGVASFNTASVNAQAGIFIQNGSALYNAINRNGSTGLSMGAGNYIGNNLNANVGPAVFGGINQGQNLCNFEPCSDVRF